jgi:hypothetical protein
VTLGLGYYDIDQPGLDRGGGVAATRLEHDPPIKEGVGPREP